MPLTKTWKGLPGRKVGELKQKINETERRKERIHRDKGERRGIFRHPKPEPGNTKGGSCTVDLLFDGFGISCMTTDNICFYFQKQTNPNQSNRRSTVQ